MKEPREGEKYPTTIGIRITSHFYLKKSLKQEESGMKHLKYWEKP